MDVKLNKNVAKYDLAKTLPLVGMVRSILLYALLRWIETDASKFGLPADSFEGMQR